MKSAMRLQQELREMDRKAKEAAELEVRQKQREEERRRENAIVEQEIKRAKEKQLYYEEQEKLLLLAEEEVRFSCAFQALLIPELPQRKMQVTHFVFLLRVID